MNSVTPFRKPQPDRPRDLLREKRLEGIGLRMPESLKEQIKRRAAARDRNISQHMLDLALADLEAQQKKRSTLCNVAACTIRAVRLAQSGIDSDAQRLWVLRQLTQLASHILNSEGGLA